MDKLHLISSCCLCCPSLLLSIIIIIVIRASNFTPVCAFTVHVWYYSYSIPAALLARMFLQAFNMPSPLLNDPDWIIPCHSWDSLVHSNTLLLFLSPLVPTAEPVTFMPITDDQRKRICLAGEAFELKCEVSDACANVRWYKDGRELACEDRVLISSDGTIRKLSLESSELSHGGEYSCTSDDDAVTFNVKIKGDLQTILLFLI